MSRDFVISKAGKIQTEKNIVVEIDGSPYSRHGGFETLEPPPPDTFTVSFYRENGSIFQRNQVTEGSYLSGYARVASERALGEIRGFVGWIGYDETTDPGMTVWQDMEFYPDISSVISVYYLDTVPNGEPSSPEEFDQYPPVPQDVLTFFTDKENSEFARKNKVGFERFVIWGGDKIHQIDIDSIMERIYNSRKKSEYQASPPVDMVIFYYKGELYRKTSGGHMCMGVYEPLHTQYSLVCNGDKAYISQSFFLKEAPHFLKEEPRDHPTRYLVLIDNNMPDPTDNLGYGLGLIPSKYLEEPVGTILPGFRVPGSWFQGCQEKPFKIITAVSRGESHKVLENLMAMYREGKRYCELPKQYPTNANPRDEESQTDGDMATRYGWGWNKENRRVLT